MNLHSDRLLIDIPEPGMAYSRSRFDWSGIIRQITLDGQHTFCSKEASPGNPGTEGIGLIHEFGIHRAVGYSESRIGDWFPKIGIGFLRRDNNGPYNFFKDYEMDPMPINLLRESDSILNFTQKTEKRNGFSWLLKREIKLVNNRINLINSLTNTGDKDIVTEEYCHNFLRFDTTVVGSNYRLELNRDLDLIQTDGIVLSKRNVVAPEETPETYFYGKGGKFSPTREITWKLFQNDYPVSVIGEERFPVSRFAIWGMKHVISPEFFLDIHLKPDETIEWKRCYTFVS